MSSGPFRLLYADPETRYHKLLPSGRRLPVVDYGPAAVWPREVSSSISTSEVPDHVERLLSA